MRSNAWTPASVALAVLSCLGAFAALSVPSWGASPKEYAYVFLQGRVTDASGRRPVVGATLRLVGGGRVFEGVTDRTGVFLFDRIPVSEYELTLTTQDGKSIRSARRGESLDPDGARLDLGVGRKGETVLKLRPEGGKLVPVIPDPPPDMGKFGKELAVFLGIVLILAL